MDWSIVVALGAILLLLLVPIVFTWYITAGGLINIVRRYRRSSYTAGVCSLDADCPSGYVCVSGKCVDLALLGDSTRADDQERTSNGGWA